MVVGELTEEVQMVVIGGGPGGYVAAIRAAQLGLQVMLIEIEDIGGVCLNRGCIPSKALITAAEDYAKGKNGNVPGIDHVVTLDFRKVQEWKDSVVTKMTQGVDMLLKGNKVRVVKGEAFFVGPQEVRVMTDTEAHNYHFTHCIIATGSRPVELASLPFGKRVLTSTEVLALGEVPKRLAIVGGGYIGIELGQAYAKFGAKVTILEGTPSILPAFDPSITRLIGRSLKEWQVEVVTGALAKSAVESADEVRLTYEVNGEEHAVSADYVLVTIGRRPNTDELGLDAAGITLDGKGLIPVDHQGRTSVANIFAIGDIVAGPALAHKASYEGKVAAEAAAGMHSAVDYACIPAVVFADPEVAVVGLNEDEAGKVYEKVKTGRFAYGANGRAVSMNAANGFVKLIADEESGVLVGAQVVGAEASNLIAELALAIEMNATLEDMALTIHAHPTLPEMVMETAEAALGTPIHMLKK